MAKKTLLKERNTNEDLYPITKVECISDYDIVSKDKEQFHRIKRIEDELNIKYGEPVYNTRVQFIIDQRYVNNLSDPDAMVSDNFIINDAGEQILISNSGSSGTSRYNFFTWLREHTHAYVSKRKLNRLYLKQLDDTTRKKFADGTSSLDYISNESGEYDVFLKFDTDIYYKSESYTPPEATEPDPDYVLITFTNELKEGENESDWQKWSKYWLVGVYEACMINNKLYSLSGKRAINNISQINSINYAKARGTGYNIINYDMHRLFALLSYGYYSSLNLPNIIGFGTNNNGQYPKITGITDDLNMVDTDTITGNGNSNDTNQMVAGIGENIKSVNFWGLENFHGDLCEWLYDIRVMQSFGNQENSTLYVAPYITENGAVTVFKPNNEEVVYNTKEEFLADYPNTNSRFVAILDNNNRIKRLLDVDLVVNKTGYIKKMRFGSEVDLVPKDFTGNQNIGYCDWGTVFGAGVVACRSYASAIASSGPGYLGCDYGPGNAISSVGARLLYLGDVNTVEIVDNLEEI